MSAPAPGPDTELADRSIGGAGVEQLVNSGRLVDGKLPPNTAVWIRQP